MCKSVSDEKECRRRIKAEFKADLKEIPVKAAAAAAVEVKKEVAELVPNVAAPVVKSDGQVVAGRSASSASTLFVGAVSLLVLAFIF